MMTKFHFIAPQGYSPAWQKVARLMIVLALNFSLLGAVTPAPARAAENEPDFDGGTTVFLPFALVDPAAAGDEAPAGEPDPVDSGEPVPDGDPADGGLLDDYDLYVVNEASTYYVATDGSDSSGTGSSSRPWKTISHAVKKVSDGSTIIVRPGTYNGKVLLDRKFSNGITIRSDKPYQAKLRNSSDKVITGTGAGYTIIGFDIAHNSGASGQYVIQIHDSRQDGTRGRRYTLRNNVIHDSYNNDLLKINNGAKDIVVEGNMFYNMGGPEVDNHIDVNSATNITIQDNLFFNDFRDSGRTNRNNTGHYIVIKDSNGDSDGIRGSRNVRVRRNVFFNWEGEVGSAFIGLGDGRKFSFHQAQDITIENNLFLGNSSNKIHGVIKIMGAKNVTFRNNTVNGDLPSNSFSMRMIKSGSGLKNVNVRFYNNIWSDPEGTMGADAPNASQRFSNTPKTDTESYSINSNLYWNNGRSIPTNSSDLINYTKDGGRVVGNPKLPTNLSDLTPPCWDAGKKQFDDGSTSIRQAFTRLVNRYGKISSTSPARNQANSNNAPSDDILKNPRNQGAPDIGAFEYRP